MRTDLFEEMYRLEEVYWWHVAKRRLVQQLIEDHVVGFSKKVYLDVGCGTGKMLEEVSIWKQWKAVRGLDGSDEALKFCRRRGVKNVKKADFEKKLPLKKESVDVVTSLDVVEHIQGDEFLLSEFYRVLRKNGVVIITVPAYKWLWTYWDDILGHKRRYRRSELSDKLRKAGFEVENVSYFYSFLLPVALVFRVLKSVSENTKKASDFVELPKPLNNLLLVLTDIERRLVKRVSLPIGLSVVCVARKKR